MSSTRWGWRVPLSTALAGALLCSALVPASAAAATEIVDTPEEYLVAVDGDPTEFRTLVTSAGGVVEDVFGRLDMLAVTLPPEAAVALDRRPDLEVEPNFTFSTEDTRIDPPSYGLDRIDQRKLPLSKSYTSPATGLGEGVNVYIFDTGIRADHKQFGGRVANGFGAVKDGRGTSDCNGHGTHVAGTVAGATVGIAPLATLVPVRILDCHGYTSSGFEFMEGLDWILAHHKDGKPAVLNMSIGADASSFVDAAVQDAVDDGIVVVVAAGNENTSACSSSPARAAAALTVAASTARDGRAAYSNYGSCVDIFAPGGDNSAPIRSAWYTGSTATAGLMGTSMATPHVAGAAARYLSTHPTATPAEVSAALLGAATAGVVNYAGSGTPNRLLYVNPAGFAGSESSQPVSPMAAPGAPTGVTATPTGVSGEVLVAWNPPSDTGGTISEYVVKISPALPSGASSRSAGSATSLVFPGVGSGPHTFTVTASNGSAVSAPSPRSNTVTLVPAELTAAPIPVVTGTRAVGQLLAAVPGTWSPGPVTLAYQWLRAGTAIPGATLSSYRLVAADAGSAVSVQVTGTKTGYTPQSRTSAAVAVPLVLTETPTPTISGSNRAGKTLTASPGAWGPAPVTLRYQWRRSGAPIAGATGATYRLTTSDAGRTVTVTVTGSKPGYSSVSKTSAGTVILRILTSKPTPKISGTPTTGATLTARAGTWGPSGVTLHYQWKRSGVPIAGADSSRYRLTAGDAGKTITVTVTGSKSGYGSVSQTSDGVRARRA
jgi:subtilisin family serine protease